VRTVVLSPGKVGSLVSYFNYFFLRFPGELGPEESLSLECLDTYDQRWARVGQVWIRSTKGLARVAPPALFPLSSDPTEFGLQAPVSLGKALVSLRTVLWELPGHLPVEGQIVKASRRSWLALRSDDVERLEVLESTLLAEGMESVPSQSATWVVSKRAPFPAPCEWPVLESPHDASQTLVDRILDSFQLARHYEPGVLQDIDTECLHQYRVHLRRARSWCSLGQPWEGLPEWTRLKTVLRRLQQETNDLRDLDVLELDLPTLCSALPWDEGVHLEGWRKSVAASRRAERLKVQRWLESADYGHLCSEVEPLCQALLKLAQPVSMGQVTETAFGKAARRLRKDLKALGDNPPDEALHELRIVSKRLRYVLDGLGDLIPHARMLTEALKGAQQALGQFQDRSVLLDRLKEQLSTVRGSKSPVDALSFGLLLGTLLAEHGVLKKRAAKAASRLGSKAFLQGLEYRHAT